MYCTITIDLFKGVKKIVSIGNLVDSPTWRVTEPIYAKIPKSQKIRLVAMSLELKYIVGWVFPAAADKPLYGLH